MWNSAALSHKNTSGRSYQRARLRRPSPSPKRPLNPCVARRDSVSRPSESGRSSSSLRGKRKVSSPRTKAPLQAGGRELRVSSERTQYLALPGRSPPDRRWPPVQTSPSGSRTRGHQPLSLTASAARVFTRQQAYGGLPGGQQATTRLPVQEKQETRVPSLGWEDSPEEGNGHPLQYSCLENPMEGGAW